MDDWGSTVSPEFKEFQTAFGKAMGDIAESIGAKLVKYNKGHYDMSGFVEKDGKYVYFSYSNSIGKGGRACASLTDSKDSFWYPMYVRTAESDTDYIGGTNHDVPFSMCEGMIQKLLER